MTEFLFVIFVLQINFFSTSLSQSISLININTKNYPLVKSDLFILDEKGKPVTNLSKSDVKIIENSVEQNVESLICNPVPAPEKLSLILTIDVSGSMIGAHLQAAQDASIQIIRTLFPGNSECAITSFNHNSYLNCDFTNDTSKLIKSIAQLSAGGGTEYDYGFYLPPAGALLVAQKARYKRIIIFFTDGVSQANYPEILNRSIELNASVYCITYGINIPIQLSNISQKTGGKIFENLKNPGEASAAFATILQHALGWRGCSIEWKSLNCDLEKTVSAIYNIQPQYFSLNTNYKINHDELPIILKSANEHYFGIVQYGKRDSIKIKLTAKNYDIVLENIVSDNNSFSVEPEFALPQYHLKEDSTVSFKIIYQPADTIYTFGIIRIVSNSCDEQYFYVSGGNRKNISHTLKLTRPKGGERLIRNSRDKITWEGVLPTDKVSLEYSLDNGSNWTILTESASSLEYIWNVPFVSQKNDSCKMRITHINPDSKDKLTFIREYHGAISALSWNNDVSGPDLLASGDDNGKILIWDNTNKILLDTIYYNSSVNALDWMPQSSEYLAGAFDNGVCIWQYKKSDKSWGKFKSFNENKSYKGLRWKPNSSLLAGGSDDGTLTIWDFGGELVTFQAHERPINTVIWDPTGNYFITGSNDKTAIIWLFSSNPKAIDTLQYISEITSLSFNQDGKYLLMSGNSPLIYVWNFLTRKLDTIFNNESEILNASAWSPRGDLIASAGKESVRIWDTLTYKLHYKFTGHSAPVTAIAWNKSGTKIATGSEDTNIEIWSPDEIPIEEPFYQSDLSLNWTIDVPSIKLDNIHIGSAYTGQYKDSVIAQFLVNKSNFPIKFDSVKVIDINTGQISQNFEIIASGFPIVLDKDESASLEIRFIPGTTKLYSEKIVVYYLNDTISAIIRGEGIASQLQKLTHIIDFGKVNRYTTKQIDTVVLRNDSNFPVNLKSTQLGPDKEHFTIYSELEKIEAHSTLNIVVEFRPQELLGMTTGGIRFTFDGALAPIDILFKGEGIDFFLDYKNRIDFENVECTLVIKSDTLNIANIGFEPVIIDSARLSGNNSDEFSIANFVNGKQIPPDKFLPLEIEFKPNSFSEKTKEAILELFISNKSEALKINLYGSSINFDFTLSTDSIDLGTHYAGSTASSTFSINNTGTKNLNWTYPIELGDFEITDIFPSETPVGGTSQATVVFNSFNVGENSVSHTFIDECGHQHSISFRADVKPKFALLQTINGLLFKPELCSLFPIDTTFVITNTGIDDLIIHSAGLLKGEDGSGSFKLTKVINNDTVKPGDFIIISLSFNPSGAPGIKSDTLILVSNAANAINDTIKIPLASVYNIVSFFIEPDSIYMEDLLPMSEGFATTTIYNTGSVPLKWNFPIQFGRYKLLNVQPPITLPESSSTAEFLFEGGAPLNNYDTTYTFKDTCGGESTVNIFVSVTDAGSMKLRTSDICGFPGDTVSLDFYIENFNPDILQFIDSIVTFLTFKKGYLVPIYPTPEGYIIGDNHCFTLTLPIEQNTGNLIARFKFKVAPNFFKDSIGINISKSFAFGTIISIYEQGSSFILGCGKEITPPIMENSQLKLYPNYPNPFNNITTIRFEVKEANDITFFLYNINGKSIIKKHIGQLGIGYYQVNLDLSGLAQGSYNYTLRTMTHFVSGKMELVK